MASSWIKMRVDLDTDPRVITMADMLAQSAGTYVLNASARDLLGVTPTVTRDAMRDVTLASLFRVWRDANRHTRDGVFQHSTLAHLDVMAGVLGFGRAMAAVGWAKEDTTTHTVTLVNFLEINTPQKSGNSTGAARQKRYRERHRNGLRDVTPTVTGDTETDRETEPESNNSPSPAPVRPRPARFPETEAAARSIAVATGVDPDLAATIWLELDATGGINDKGQTVTSFASYIKMRSNYRQSKQLGDKQRQQRPLTGETTGQITEGERKVLYARYMAAKEEASDIRQKSYHTEEARQKAAARLHELERLITDLETKHSFTSK